MTKPTLENWENWYDKKVKELNDIIFYDQNTGVRGITYESVLELLGLCREKTASLLKQAKREGIESVKISKEGLFANRPGGISRCTGYSIAYNNLEAKKKKLLKEIRKE